MRSFCIYNVVTVLPFPDQFRYESGWVLKVSVNDDDSISDRFLQASSQRDFLAEVAAQVNQRYSIVRLPEFLDDAQCFVRAAVIDIGDLKIKRQAGQYFGNGLVKFRQNYFFIEYRRYD